MRSDSECVVIALQAVGRNCTYDLHDVAGLSSLAKTALIASGATLVAEFDHTFVPHGATIVLVAAESHLVLSTWPEFGTATLDVALCGPDVDPERGWAHLVEHLRPESVESSTVRRALT